ncbi:hypothetical protein [Stenotrophomonas bentonitica]|uniref:hypothetical protein n=1 Tax=Stenotrophomonas bentonitica TaxID=1450134 RepID=UPI0031BA3C88
MSAADGLAVLDAMMAPVSKPTLADICRLQDAISQLPQHDFVVEHSFLPGQYLRKLIMPAGTLLVGKRHRHRHALIVTGHVTVRTERGMVELQGTHVIDSLPGMKRAIYAHADSVLITSHLTEETDLDKIEAHVIMPDDAALEIEGETK